MNKYFILFTMSFLVFCCVGSSSTYAMDVEPDESGSKTKILADTSFPDFHWKKVTSSRDDLFTFWELNEALVKRKNNHTKYITLEKHPDFEAFYNETIKVQNIPDQKTTYLELNDLSGVYLFYLSKQEAKPIGFLKISAALDCNWVEGSVAVKAGSPKGIGTKALQVLTNLFEPYRGQELMFCIEHKAADQKQPTYAFAKRTLDHVIGGIEYANIASLIANTRVGMEPFLPVRSDAGKGKQGVYLAYPPLDHAKFAEKFHDCYVNQIEPHNESMEELSGILQDVSSRDLQIREKGLNALKIFEGEKRNNHAPKPDCTIL